MKLAADNVLNFSNNSVPSEIAPRRLDWDLKQIHQSRFEFYQKRKKIELIPKEVFMSDAPICLDIGAGTGDFFLHLARLYPETIFVSVERWKKRALRLLQRYDRESLKNLVGLRGNCIPPLVHGIPNESVDHIFILYPCPWPKPAHRKNRWYLSPLLYHLLRVLKKGGLILWASDQKFYIDEAHYVLGSHLQLEVLSHGILKPNVWNQLYKLPEGRTHFEKRFLSSGQACFELICRK